MIWVATTISKLSQYLNRKLFLSALEYINKKVLDCMMEVRGSFILLKNKVSKDFLMLWETLQHILTPDTRFTHTHTHTMAYSPTCVIEHKRH